MLTRISELKNEFSLLNTTEKRKQEIVKELLDELINLYPVEGQSIINTIYNTMRELEGKINQKEASNKIKQAANTSRNNLIRQNKYTAEHPYVG